MDKQIALTLMFILAIALGYLAGYRDGKVEGFRDGAYKPKYRIASKYAAGERLRQWQGRKAFWYTAYGERRLLVWGIEKIDGKSRIC